MLLSFKPEVFELIASGKKIYEYRRQFPNEEIRAYMYVSSPVRKIVGYIDLGERISLQDWKEKYSNDKEVSERIEEYIARNNRYVMPIKHFQMTTSISVEDLQANLSKFIVPQSYYYLETFAELKDFIHTRISDLDHFVDNDFTVEDSNQVCVRKYY